MAVATAGTIITCNIRLRQTVIVWQLHYMHTLENIHEKTVKLDTSYVSGCSKISPD